MRSDRMKKGVERAPHRSLLKALGLTDKEISQPIIGVASSANEVIPGHMHLKTIEDAVGSARIRLAKEPGMQVMKLVERDLKPRDIVTEDAFYNAVAVDLAMGGSTNTTLHLPAIANSFLGRYSHFVQSAYTGAVLRRSGNE